MIKTLAKSLALTILAFTFTPGIARAFSPVRYVQISTNTLTRQTGTAVVAGVNVSTITASSATFSGGLAMSNTKVTGLAAATADGDALRYEQLKNMWRYRRPKLSFVSVTTVDAETGLDGTSGDCSILFPDGDFRTVNSTTMSRFDITRNAAFSGSKQSGLRPSLSEATNTWYALYAVKATDNATDFVIVGDTTLNLQANFATLNSAYGTNGWIYVGMIRNGDNSGATGDILAFIQHGNFTVFDNTVAGNSNNGTGIRLATTAGATSLTYTWASGIGAAQIPSNIGIAHYGFSINAGTGVSSASNAANTWALDSASGASRRSGRFLTDSASGLLLSNGSSVAMDVYLSGYIDGCLGIGSNPLL
jgi:hypothetical protein